MASVGKPSNPPSSQVCIENLSVGRSLLDLVLSPSDTLRRGGSDALENLHVEAGETQVEIAAALAAVLVAVLASRGNFAGGIGRFILSLSPSLFLPSPSRLSLLSETPKGYRVTASDRDSRSG